MTWKKRKQATKYDTKKIFNSDKNTYSNKHLDSLKQMLNIKDKKPFKNDNFGVKNLKTIFISVFRICQGFDKFFTLIWSI